MINITVDLGNYNVKFMGDRKGIFSSKYSTKFNSNSEMFERIEYDGEITYIGIGTLDNEFVKVNKNYMASLLYAITKATNESDINLGLLLPVGQMSNKEKYIKRLENNTFNFKVNGQPKTINIFKVAVLPESYSAFYAIKDNIVSSEDGVIPDALVIDIGSRTVNYTSFLNGKIEKNFTERLGVLDFYNTVKEIENANGEDYVDEDIERLINTNRIVVDSKIYKDFFKDILNRTKSKVNIKNYKVYFTGGGALVLREFIQTNTPATVIDDAVFANVIGAHKLCEMVWRGNK